MTRGKIAMLLDGKMYVSIEFNGDMDECHGKEVIERLECVRSLDDFERCIQIFNRNNFGYLEDLVHQTRRSAEEMCDMSTDYFSKWFSDYVYILNLEDAPVTFTLKNGTYELPPKGIGVANFGNYISEWPLCKGNNFRQVAC